MLGVKSKEYVAETVIAISGTPEGVLPVKSLTLAGPPLTIGQSSDAVSYTHLTLPTILLV